MASAALLCGCEDLDLVHTEQISSVTMWTTEEYADAGMAAIYDVFNPINYGTVNVDPRSYAGFGRFLRCEAISFCSNGIHSNYIQSATLNPGNSYFSLEWKYIYSAIHTCNDAIANLSKAPISEEKYRRYMAEAKFMRAFFYHYLNTLYQGVPIYLEPVENSSCNRTQSTAAEVWNVVLSDLNDCIAESYMPDNTLKQYYGRPSKGAAYALRGMVYVWQKKWAEAAADFEKVKQCGYGLWDGEYIDFFTEANEKDKEMILPAQYQTTVNYGNPIGAALGSRCTLQGVNYIEGNAEFVDTYLNADGSEFKWSQIFPDWDNLEVNQREVFFVRDGMNSGIEGVTDATRTSSRKSIIGRVGQDIWDKYYLDDGNQARIEKAYTCRDPRLMQTFFTPSSVTMTYASPGGQQSAKTMRWPYLIAGNGNPAGDFWPDNRNYYNYEYRKFVNTNRNDIDRMRSGCDMPLIRFTDIWLQYAECLNELGRYGDAVNVINEIRTRAHMPSLVVGGAAPNGVSGHDDILKRIQYERRVELCAEGINYFDEVRWGTYKATRFQGQEVNYFRDMWGRAVRWTIYYHDEVWPWPAPSSEVQLNPNLAPTAGWSY